MHVSCMYACMYTVKDGMTIDSENKILLCLTTLLLKRQCRRSSWLYSFGLALAVGHRKRPWAEINLFHNSLSFLLGKILCNSAILLVEEPKETSAATSGCVAVIKVFNFVYLGTQVVGFRAVNKAVLNSNTCLVATLKLKKGILTMLKDLGGSYH